MKFALHLIRLNGPTAQPSITLRSAWNANKRMKNFDNMQMH